MSDCCSCCSRPTCQDCASFPQFIVQYAMLCKTSSLRWGLECVLKHGIEPRFFQGMKRRKNRLSIFYVRLSDALRVHGLLVVFFWHRLSGTDSARRFGLRAVYLLRNHEQHGSYKICFFLSKQSAFPNRNASFTSTFSTFFPQGPQLVGIARRPTTTVTC